MVGPNILYYIMIAELFLMGSGQLIHIGPFLTLRMIIWAICIATSVIFFIKGSHLHKHHLYLLAYYTISLVIPTTIGLLTDASMDYIFTDIKPLIFFYILPFVCYSVTNESTINKTLNIIYGCSLIMSYLYVCYIFLIKIGIFNFEQVYAVMGPQSDFAFREQTGEFFYKGFIFLPLGLIMALTKRNWISAIAIVLAIYFSKTRGFYVIALIGVVLWYLLSSKINIAKILIMAIGIVIGLLTINYIGLFEVNDARLAGDQIRIDTFNQVIESIDIRSALIGHGFGHGVEIRPVHMECSFLEIFHKQGLFGLLFYLSQLGLIIWLYIKTKKTTPETLNICNLLLIGVIMIYIQSIFNPFINNPMGIEFVILSIVVLNYLCINEHPKEEI